MQRRIDTAPVLAAASALLLLVSLFLDWYSPDDSAWTAFEAWDLVLAAVAVAALAAAARALGLVGSWPRRTDGLLPLLGAVALVIVASQLLNPPPNALDRELEVGAWLGFVGAIGLAVAGVMSAARVSFEVSVRARGGGAGEGAGTGAAEAPTTRMGDEPGAGGGPGAGAGPGAPPDRGPGDAV